jgi:hypothetical protein
LVISLSFLYIIAIAYVAKIQLEQYISDLFILATLNKTAAKSGPICRSISETAKTTDSLIARTNRLKGFRLWEEPETPNAAKNADDGIQIPLQTCSDPTNEYA